MGPLINMITLEWVFIVIHRLFSLPGGRDEMDGLWPCAVKGHPERARNPQRLCPHSYLIWGFLKEFKGFWL